MLRTVLLWLIVLGITPLQAAEEIINAHFLSSFSEDTALYSADATHYAYVNPEAPKGGKLVLATSSQSYDSLNPFIVQGKVAAGIGFLYDTLMTSSWEEPETYYGLIADKVTYPKNRKWIIFHLRDYAKFHDGSPIRAEDIIYSFEVLKDIHPSLMIYLRGIERVEDLGHNQVKFTFTGDNTRELPLICASMPIISKAYWQKHNIREVTLTPWVGSGPYNIKTLDQGRSITYVRVPDYWGKDLLVNKGRYNFDEIVYDYYRDYTVMQEAFKAGLYDLRYENSARDWQTAYTSLEHNPKFKRKMVYTKTPEAVQGWIFNLRNPLFQDHNVREALQYAFDFEWRNKNMAFGLHKRTRSYWQNSELEAKGLPKNGELTLLRAYRAQLPLRLFQEEYTPPQTKGDGNNRAQLKRAQDLLKEAGWILENGKLVHQDTKQPFVFTILEHDDKQQQLNQMLVSQLKRLGIEAKIRHIDTPQWINLMRDYKFDMTSMVYSNSLTPGTEQKIYWGSEAADKPGSANYIGIKNPIIDDLIEQQLKAQNRDELIQATRALDRVLQWQFYLIPHFYLPFEALLYWDKFGMPDVTPELRGDDILSWYQKP